MLIHARSWAKKADILALLGAVLLLASTAQAELPCGTATELVKRGVNLGDGSDAEVALYREADLLCPKMAEIHFNLGLALQKKAQLKEAIIVIFYW